MCIIQDPLGEKANASLAPLRCFGAANHSQRQKECPHLPAPSHDSGQSLWTGIQKRFGLFQARCPSCNPLAHRHWHLSVIKTHSHKGSTLGWGTLLNVRFSPSHTHSPQQLYQSLRAAVMRFTAPPSVRRSDKIFL